MVLSVMLVLHHEIWMDEAYHYLLARDSTSLADLFRKGTQTGHPVFWNELLFLYKYLFSGILPMQLLHCSIAGICVFLINRYSPFTRFENILISFGYFFLYEYNIIAKNYMPGFCLVFAAIVLYDRKKSFLMISVLLGLACNFHLFTLFVSLSLFVYMILSKEVVAEKKVRVLGFVLMILGIVCAIYQIMPSTQHINMYKSYDAPSFWSLDRAGRSLAVMCRGLVNIPDFRKPDYWNSNLIFNVNRIACYLVSLLVSMIVFFSFKRRPLILLLFFIPVSLIMLFVYVMPLSTGVRYWGYCYVLLIICFWLYKKQEEPKPYSKLFFKIVLGIQVIVAIPALWIEYHTPFSNAKYAAQSLKDAGLLGRPLFVQSLSMGPSLCAYGNTSVYYPANKTFETFSYDVNHKQYLPEDFLKECLRDLKVMKLDTCILVMSAPLDSSFNHEQEQYRLHKIAFHKGAIITSENYYLYLLSTN